MHVDKMIICGDFNLPHIDWIKSTSSTKTGKDLLDFLNSFSLVQNCIESTRLNSILDLCISTNDLISQCTTEEGISDHKSVRFYIEIPEKNLDIKNSEI